jgi:hypothetical protein
VILTPRWQPLRHHPMQWGYWTSPHRFNVVPAGRRGGKTEIAKRRLVRAALKGSAFDPPRFFAAAPTRDQAKRIYWDDLKAMVPDSLKLKTSETDLMIKLLHGSEIWVQGLDKPARVEGSPWDGGILDEYADMKAEAFNAHVRPALSDRLGWCDLIGVPEGRNHYYGRYTEAARRMAEEGPASPWGAFTWPSADILPQAEVEEARKDLDPQTFQQEYEASFINFQGQCYYPFDRQAHCAPLPYDPALPLVFCFDFNVSPGVAAVAQEGRLPSGLLGTRFIGEVWIDDNSNTPKVCQRLVDKWKHHKGQVVCYGDATGGARGTAAVAGSDWDLVLQTLRPHFDMRLDVPKANPPERVRVNAVNTRLQAGNGDIHLQIDPKACPRLVEDFEGVPLKDDGSGDIDKKKYPRLTHISDAAGYYIERKFPVSARRLESTQLMGV